MRVGVSVCVWVCVGVWVCVDVIAEIAFKRFKKCRVLLAEGFQLNVSGFGGLNIPNCIRMHEVLLS